MASINNFSLVGIGSSVKLGKGGIVLAQSSGKLTVDTVALATETFVTGQNYLTAATAATTYQPLDGDLTSIAGLTGTTGFLTKTAANTWVLDTNTYLSASTAASTYAPINNPTFTGTVTLAADPVSALQAATKQYVDGISAGLTFKAAVRVATTANVGTYSSGQITGVTNTVDGIALAAGDRILVKSQTNALENGIYSVTTVGTGANGVWARSSDFDEPSEVHGGTFIFVNEGDTLADKGFVLISDDPITLGTDPLVWSQYSSTGTISITAGTGIDVANSLGAYTVSLADISGVAGSFGAANKAITLTVDGQGRITAVADANIAIDWTQITTGKPTTLAGYGITDGLSTATTYGGDVTGTYNAITLATIGTPVTNSFVKITTDTKGRVTATTAIVAADLNTVYGYTPVNPSSLSTVATTGAYADLSGKPDLTVYLKADGTVALTGNLDLGTHNIVNVTDPVNAQDAATKNYVDVAVASATSGSTLTKSAAFTFSTTTANIVSAIPTGAVVTRVVVKVTSAFTGGTSPIVSVERDTQVLDDGTGSDLATAGTYVIDSYESIISGGALTLTVTAGGATAGAGTVFVEYAIIVEEPVI